ncbi:VWA domain-containing protein [Sulfurimonas sp. HSL3-7]|uniref:VWA domain-containing protein n=1 Tax=Sulfonitrofixus jiaomeiensis TaxID=3131938 RepID=UPI0031F82842
MTFLYPEFIYMMLPVLIVLFALLLTQSEVQEQLFSPKILEKLRVDTNRLSTRVRNFFYFLMFLFIIMALAGPVIEKGIAKVQVKDDAFFVALDISDSMLCDDIYPTRLERAKLTLLELLQAARSSQIGLLAFAKESYLLSPPTLDHRSIAFFLKGLQGTHISEQGTNILTLLKAADKLFAQDGEKKLLIVSDGGDSEAFSREIAFAKERGIKVFVLGVATDRGAPLRESGGGLRKESAERVVISRLNRGISRLAEESGGTFVSIESMEMNAFLQKISGEKLNPSEKEQPIYFHLFVFFIGMAMLMLLIATSSFGKGERYHLPALLLLAVNLVQPAQLKASLFDYRNLDEAKSAYENEAFRASAKGYHRYGIEHKSAEAIYNEANALYRLGRYERAIGLYNSIHFVEAQKNHLLYHNLGNALVKLGDEAHLKKAVEAYNKALRFQEDQASRENLAMVEELLRKGDRRALKQPAAAAAARSAKMTPEADVKKVPGVTALSQEEERGMSDREAKKWLKILGEHQSLHPYKIAVDDPDEGGDDEKPW